MLIKFYEFSTHTIYLKKEKSIDDHSFLYAKPFVVIASNSRIYLGQFYYFYSSYIGKNPMIVDFGLFDKNQLIVKINKALGSQDPNFVDVRNDYRIMISLMKFGIYRD